MKYLTGKNIRKQLAGHYSSYIVVILLIAAILGFCAIFCGTQLGWIHLFTIIGIAAFAVSLVLFLIVLSKLAKINQHRIFRRYGSAEDIAFSINQGLTNPRYIADSFGLLIAEHSVPRSEMNHVIAVLTELVPQLVLKEMRSL